MLVGGFSVGKLLRNLSPKVLTTPLKDLFVQC